MSLPDKLKRSRPWSLPVDGHTTITWYQGACLQQAHGGADCQESCNSIPAFSRAKTLASCSNRPERSRLYRSWVFHEAASCLHVALQAEHSLCWHPSDTTPSDDAHVGRRPVMRLTL